MDVHLGVGGCAAGFDQGGWTPEGIDLDPRNSGGLEQRDDIDNIEEIKGSTHAAGVPP